MASRKDFASRIADLGLSHVERAIAFLWYYDYTQDYEERSPSELAGDLHDEGFPRPNVTRLREELQKSRLVICGSRKGSFQLDLRRKSSLNEQYRDILAIRTVQVSGSVLNPESVSETRGYLERLVYQINGSYEYGFYDSTAVMCRRLMESLLIEIYIHQKRTAEIRQGASFFQLEKLIAHVCSDSAVTLSRNAPKMMGEIKQLGDTAAHDRVYITQQVDIDDLRMRFRRLIQELLVLSGVKT